MSTVLGGGNTGYQRYQDGHGLDVRWHCPRDKLEKCGQVVLEI